MSPVTCSKLGWCLGDNPETHALCRVQFQLWDRWITCSCDCHQDAA